MGIFSNDSIRIRTIGHYIQLRESMKAYIKSTMQEAHEKGMSVIKTLFNDFPNDPTAWEAKKLHQGGQEIEVDAPLLRIPLFVRSEVSVFEPQ